jgi:hypothetical protein
MLNRIAFWVGVAITLAGVPLVAQDRQGMPGGAMMQEGPRGGPAAAELFLAMSGELRLSDAQVTRLAAIARRGADRRRAMRATMDSTMQRMQSRPAGPPDSALREMRMRQAGTMRAAMERNREASRTDLRDALAVLTPDQLAQAWEMGMQRGRGMRARNAEVRVRRMRGNDDGDRRIEIRREGDRKVEIEREVRRP